MEVKVVVDVKKAEKAGCRFRKTGNLVWLTSQTIPPEAIVKFEEWDDLADKGAASSSHDAPGGGLWEPKELEGRPYTENAYTEHVHENGFSRPQGAFTYTPPFSRPYRGFHDFHRFSRTFMVFARPFAHIFTYIFWFSRPSPVFTPTPCFHVHTVIFEFIWPNGLWTHFSCPNGPPGKRYGQTQDVAHTLAEAVAGVPEGASLKVDPATFAVEVCGEGEKEEPASSEEEECDWDPSAEEEAEVVQAIPAKTEFEMEGATKMEIVEDAEPSKRRKKLQLGSAQILLLQAVGDADASNWASLQQCIQTHNTTGQVKCDFVRRLEQLADLRQESRQGAAIALQNERDRAWRVTRAETLYRSELDDEMIRLEKYNPVGPRVSQPLITDARLKADIDAGVGVWRARRDHRARVRTCSQAPKGNPGSTATCSGTPYGCRSARR